MSSCYGLMHGCEGDGLFVMLGVMVCVILCEVLRVVVC